MKVIINAHGYVGQAGGAGGAGVFLEYLVSCLADECQVDVLVKPNSKTFRGLPRSARFIELPYLTAETLQRLRVGPTVVLDPFGGVPCGPFPDDMGLCVVIHDLMHLERPYFFTEAERIDRSKGFAAGLQRADSIVTFSADQARAVRHFFPGTHPIVIPHLPYMTLDKRVPTGGPGGLPVDLGRYILFPGVKWPHKNHKTAIEAFEAYTASTRSNIKLIICGGACAENRFSFYPSVDKSSPQIIDLGLVSDKDIRTLYRDAEAVLFPTLYEGFGIPVLEAAYQGKMIVASGLKVFDEILGSSNYRRVDQPLCHVRWMRAFRDVEDAARRDHYEKRSKEVQERLDVDSFRKSFISVFTKLADRYTHPSLYPSRDFANGDRLTSTTIASLDFGDIYGSASAEKGPRQPVLGPKLATQGSTIFRSTMTSADRKVCLRAAFDTSSLSSDSANNLEFSAWVRLLGAPSLDRLNWSANDLGLRNLLPTLADGEWHPIRAAVPKSGFIDFRGVRAGESEVCGFDIEIHDPCIVRTENLRLPKETPSGHRLTVVVAALKPEPDLQSVISAIGEIGTAIPAALKAISWMILTRSHLKDAPAGLPENVDIYVVAREMFTRSDAIGLISPYQPISSLLLLESSNLRACLGAENLRALLTALRPSPLRRNLSLSLNPVEEGFWSESERGHVIGGLESRVGEPIPVLDPAVIRNALDRPSQKQLTRFAVVETDATSNISHHTTVTRLFLDGAKALGYLPVLGLHRSATARTTDELVAWPGFTAQVYAIGTAEAFAEELRLFVSSAELGKDDIVFMHSLSPAIVLGAARFIAANPDTAPRFAMRFFSTSEAMRGHTLSYTKILRSIESTRTVRQRMHFFCESKNLVKYFEEQVGCTYPLLFSPEHPSLGMVRASTWLDPGLGNGVEPTLAFFGEAREEKGFDDLPAILAALLASEQMSGYRFLIQTGSNSGNDTPKMLRAKEALSLLKLKYPGRVRTFQSVETPEQFYFLMKHAQGVIAPYKPSAYGKRGSGVTLEALQMGLEVFAWEATDLFATYADTGRVIGVKEGCSFASAIIEHYQKTPGHGRKEIHASLIQSPAEACERLLSHCFSDAAQSGLDCKPVLWVGNDTFGEGCSAVYSAQKYVLQELGYDCYELYVPWPDPNWAGVNDTHYDAIVYGFDSQYESSGLAWIAKPKFNSKQHAVLDLISREGPTYRHLRSLNDHFLIPATLRRAVALGGVHRTILNYSHLYPVIAGAVPMAEVICEMHDIIAYQNAVRRDNSISLVEKVDEFSDLAEFPIIVAISANEQREVSGACTSCSVQWRLPPYIPELSSLDSTPDGASDVSELLALGAAPDDVTYPTLPMLRAYYARPDLQSAFRLSDENGRLAFFRWWFFFGQFEVFSGFGLSRKQYLWAIGANEDNSTTKFDGVLKLILSIRRDLRQTFLPKSGLDLKGLLSWARENMQREFGFSIDQIIKYGELESVKTDAQCKSLNSKVVSAVLDSDPTTIRQHPEDAHRMLDRISEIDQIDLVLVGSAHPSNIKSFTWFINEVFLEYFANKGRNLFVVGSVCNVLKDIVHPRLVLLGRCARISPILAASRACPLPIMFGSGSPIKAIPAIALNGAVSVSNHVDRAFALSEYGIPALYEPREFADDLWSLLLNDEFRRKRQECAKRYFQDHLTVEGYVEFWKTLLAA